MNEVIQEDVRALTEELRDTVAALAGTTLLVTGGSGFLASYLLDSVAWFNDYLLARPCRLISMDNLRSGKAERTAHLSARPEFRFVETDISQPFDLGEHVDWIVHGAGIASPTFYRRYPLETIDVNVSGTRQVLELARRDGVRSVVSLSTSEIYGDPDPRFIPTAEDYRGHVSCTGPRACYDESKRLGETLCAVYRGLYGLPVKVVRPFNVYGPGQRLDDRRIIPDLMAAAVSQRPLVLYGDGRATRSFCYIRDAIHALWLILISDADGEVFNIGNDEGEITIRELALLVQKIAGPPPPELQFAASTDPHYLTDNPQRRCPDLTKLRRWFPWQPRVGLAEGLRRTLRSYGQRPANGG